LTVLSVDTGEILVFTTAGFKGTVLSVVGGVVLATDTVKDVFAEFAVVRSGGVTGFEAEEVGAHEVVPLENLLIPAVA
jgi:hypothetical protein